MGTIQKGEILFYYQTKFVDDENNYILAEYVDLNEHSFFEEVKKLAKEGKKLEAVVLFKYKSGMGLKESKDWVDNNC